MTKGVTTQDATARDWLRMRPSVHAEAMIVDEPLLCTFDVPRFLKQNRCSNDDDGANCFTGAQAGYVLHLYNGSYDTQGQLVYPGVNLGSEYLWDRFIPIERNDLTPYVLQSIMRVFQSMFDEDPGVAPADVSDVTQSVNTDLPMPEWPWWEYDPEQLFTDSTEMSRIIDPTDADLHRFLVANNGKLLLYQGWDEPYHSSSVLLDYFDAVVEETFAGDIGAAGDSLRLFMMPGVQHCFFGPGPDLWERFEPAKKWVEKGEAPDRIIAIKKPFDVVTNERPLCPFPQTAVYTGPEAGRNDPQHWHAANFECRYLR